MQLLLPKTRLIHKFGNQALHSPLPVGTGDALPFEHPARGTRSLREDAGGA